MDARLNKEKIGRVFSDDYIIFNLMLPARVRLQSRFMSVHDFQLMLPAEYIRQTFAQMEGHDVPGRPPVRENSPNMQAVGVQN
jgi:hypothetical protein